MPPRFFTILPGRNLPKVRQPREPEASTINDKTIADFTRLVEQAEILKGDPTADNSERKWDRQISARRHF